MKRFASIFMFFIVVLAPPFIYAGPEDSCEYQTLIFYLENDIFAGTDRYYTNGAKLIWISKDLDSYAEDKRLPSLLVKAINYLPLVTGEEPGKNIALTLGQKIFTPNDITRPDLIPDDRPYAGWSYAGIALHEKTADILDTLEIDIGMVGPNSYAREIQVNVHDWIKTRKPMGWKHQLKNEVGLIVVYERKWRLTKRIMVNSSELDCIGHMGATVGNIYAYANSGIEVRFGYNLPADFGTALIRPAGDASIPASDFSPGSSGFHSFAGLDCRAVARNIFLDGNTFKESHSVDKKYFVADLMVGLSFNYQSLKITYSHVYKTKEFRAQKEGQIFGLVNIAYTF